MNKHKNNSYTSLERYLSIAGLSVVIIGFIANIYYAYVNQRFFQSSPNITFYIFYLNYVITLGGGFLAGYWLTKKDMHGSRLLSGVTYAFLATLFFFLLSAVQFRVRILWGDPPYPWGMLLFNCAPLFGLLIAVGTAYVLQYRQKKNGLSIRTMFIFAISFLVYVINEILNNAYFAFTAHSQQLDTPLWITVGNYLDHPLVITVVAYMLLRRINGGVKRLFYATFIGTLAYILTLLLWNFQTDPSVDAVNQFQVVNTVIVVFATGFILWRSHSAINNPKVKSV